MHLLPHGLSSYGDDDLTILPRYTHLLGRLLPNARTKIYPDAAHAFLFQYAHEFAAEVNAFLGD
jgi:pimeloyl-ACP methyl ester carboxylesterase